MPFTPVLHPTPPQTSAPKARKFTRNRRFWAAVPIVLSLLAVGVEAVFHLCASLLFDPLPDLVTGVAYAWVIFFLWFNRTVLVSAAAAAANELSGAVEAAAPNALLRYLGPKRAAGIALAGTPVALLAAGMATWMFLPVLPFALLLRLAAAQAIADIATGASRSPMQVLVPALVGPLVFVPLIDFILLLIQWRGLRNLWKTHAGAIWEKRVAAGAVLVGCAAVFFLILRPALIGHWTARSLHTKGEAQARTLARLRLLGGQQAMLDLTYRRNPPYWVCLGYQAEKEGVWPWVGYGWSGGGMGSGLNGDDAHAARRAYFLMTGTPFESVPRPISSVRQNQLNGPDDVAVEETGGYVVGRPVPV